jgi:high-affinity nickel permease
MALPERRRRLSGLARCDNALRCSNLLRGSYPSTMHTALYLALLTASLLGFRHGFDYDHIAAITDIVSVQSSRRTAMRLGMIYALGHALTVAVLGSVVVLFGVSLPTSIDRWAERLVGLTLLVLGIYVLSTLILRPRGDLPKSRYMLLHQAFHHTKSAFVQRLYGTPRAPYSAPGSFDTRSVFMVGVVHGLGAETPSQLMIFLLAANLGGAALGMLGLGMFLAGLLVMNALMTASAAGAFGFSQHRPVVFRVVSAVTGVYSVVMGVVFLSGRSSILPALN